MASRQPRGGAPQSGAAGASAASSRSNEYFVPRDGIDREVITADICRYLGNDALVRPGHYENPQTGQGVQGYYITAYRNLTTAMIDDLKADSARWEAERRQQAVRNAPAGYRESATHNARQHFGPTDSAGGYTDGRDPYDTPRYPGSQAPGYSGNSGSYPSQGGGPAHNPVQASYGSTGGYQYPSQSATYSQSDPRYPSSQTTAYGQPDPYTAVNANSAVRQQYSDPYGASQAAQRIPVSAAPGPGQTYGQAPAGYGGAPGYYAQQQQAAGYSASQAQPQESIYGRASPAGTSQAFSSAPGQQYAPNPTARTAASPSSSTQMASSGTSHSRREREPTDRHRGSRR